MYSTMRWRVLSYAMLGPGKPADPMSATCTQLSPSHVQVSGRSNPHVRATCFLISSKTMAWPARASGPMSCLCVQSYRVIFHHPPFSIFHIPCIVILLADSVIAKEVSIQGHNKKTVKRQLQWGIFIFQDKSMLSRKRKLSN